MAKQMVRLARVLKVVLLLGSAAAGALPAGANAAAGPPCRIAVLGDSLTSGYGLALEEAFPAKLEQALRASGFDCAVLDAGVSGDTSAGGRARLEWVLADEPTHVIVELGGNDGLRALDPAEMEGNLDAILARLKDEDVHVLLAGMLAPPNLGREYGQAFKAVFPRLAEKHDVPLYPFFLEGVALNPELNLPDGIHPSAEGVAVIVENILPAVLAWLRETSPGA